MRIVERIILSAAVMLATGVGAARAGDLTESGNPAGSLVGSTVRVTYLDASPATGAWERESREIGKPAVATVTGELLPVSGDSLTVRTSRGTRTVVVPWHRIRKVELKTGASSKLARAVIIGGAGISVGALISASESSSSANSGLGLSAQEATGAGIAVIGIAAALVSLAFDASQWREIHRDDIATNRIRFGFGGGSVGQAGLFLSGRF